MKTCFIHLYTPGESRQSSDVETGTFEKNYSSAQFMDIGQVMYDASDVEQTRRVPYVYAGVTEDYFFFLKI